jgi:hypothetical protein
VRGRRTVFGVVGRRARGALPAAPRLQLAGAAALLCALAAAGCGEARQDAGEHSASFDMAIVRASFPAKQAVARPATLELQVRNTGSHPVPNVAVTVDSFNYSSNYAQLADSKRPIWAIEQGPGARANPPVESQEVSQPGSGQTAYVNTWALGALGAGQTRTFSWHVTPLKPGAHTVHFVFAAGLSGKARARLAAGGPVQGQFAVNIAPAPPTTYVNPSTGKVVAGTAPTTP